MITISKIGYQYFNVKGFEVNRPNGSGDFLFLYFRCPTEVFLNGSYQILPENTYFLYQQDTPQMYRKLDGHYLNDWIHFEIDPYDNFFESLNIPFETPMTLRDNQAISEMISDLFIEYFDIGEQHEVIMDQKARALFHKFSDLYHSSGKSNSNMTRYRRELIEMRKQLQNYGYLPRDTKIIADSLNISISYLQHLYKDFFGTSIQQDIIRCRIEHAAGLLRTTTFPVAEIAAMTGYENFEHFSRQFKKIMGCSPSTYRKEL